MPVLKGALIGCGFFGKIQLEAWTRMPEVEIVAACDPVLERAQSAAERGYTSAAEMLEREELDFVDIATRPDTHLPLVKLALERKVPAICQKPLAENMEQARELAALGGRVMVHENWRWQPWYREAKRRIAAGEIGRPLTHSFRIRQRDGLGDQPFPNQPYFREMPRLLIYETLIHPIDTARFLFGEIERVTAHARRYNPLIRGEDRAVVILEHAGDVDGVVDGSRYANPVPAGPAMGDATLEGDEGVIQIHANGDLFLNGTRVFQSPTELGYKGDSVLATQRHFVECLASGREFETSVAGYLPSYAAVEAAYRSVAENRPVALSEFLEA